MGDVGMPEPPSERLPVPAGDGSAVVGAEAALDCVGAPAARLSIWVPIEPPPGEDDVPPDDAGVGADCGLGDDRPDTGEPPECEGPDVLGVLDEPPESVPPGGLPPDEGSSKSDRDGPVEGVGLECGLSEEDGLPESDPEPESGPAPTFGAPMSLPPVSADIPPPMPAPGPVPLRVEVEESGPDEGESEELEFEVLDDEASEDEDLELSAPLSLSPSLPPSPPDNPDGPSYPSRRLSIASRARLPAFWPRLSRTPSAKV